MTSVWLRRLGWLVLGLLAAAAVALGGVAVWLAEGDEADPAALAAATVDHDVVVSRADGVVVVSPPAGVGDVAVVFYPGARIEPDAYVATWAPIVARTGISVMVPGMPLNWAAFDRGRALEVRATHPEVSTWLLGGHSLGGLTATRLVADRTDVPWAGLVLWASTAERDVDLVDQRLPVLVVGGELDDVVPTDFLDVGGQDLPPGTTRVDVAGMTHSQFGRYGRPPAADGRSDAATLADLVAATSAFLDDVVTTTSRR